MIFLSISHVTAILDAETLKFQVVTGRRVVGLEGS
jgi:hypothetical protein